MADAKSCLFIYSTINEAISHIDADELLWQLRNASQCAHNRFLERGVSVCRSDVSEAGHEATQCLLPLHHVILYRKLL